MTNRQTVKTQKDHTIFHNTAAKTKKINIAPKKMRGGIRL